MMKAPAQHMSDHDWVNALRCKGLRATNQRVAVLNFLHHNPHAAVEAVYHGIRPKLPTISLQAIHLIVQDLSGQGIIRRVSLPDSNSARYETRIDDNHHHVQCIQCGRIEDVDCAVGHAPCLDPSHAHGMRVVEAQVVFRGICHDCELPTNEGK